MCPAPQNTGNAISIMHQLRGLLLHIVCLFVVQQVAVHLDLHEPHEALRVDAAAVVG
jgi:hypothetical protein